MVVPSLLSLTVALTSVVYAARPSDEGASEDNDTFGEDALDDMLSAEESAVTGATGQKLSSIGSLLSLSILNASSFHSKVTDHSMGIPPVEGEGVDIKEEWMDYLFMLIDEDGGGTIQDFEWKKFVKGQWAELMWPVLDANKDGAIDMKEFKTNWDPAVTAAFEKMGGADDKMISEKEQQAWGATKYEKAFAAKELTGDGQMTCKEPCMDRGDFEEFIFTAMVFRALDKNGDGDITYKEVKWKFEDNKNGKLEPFKDLLGDEAAFKKAFGKDGLQLGELLKLENDNKAFITSDAELNKSSESDVEKAKDENEAMAMSEGTKNSATGNRVVILVAAIVAAAVWAFTDIPVAAILVAALCAALCRSR